MDPRIHPFRDFLRLGRLRLWMAWRAVVWRNERGDGILGDKIF